MTRLFSLSRLYLVANSFPVLLAVFTKLKRGDVSDLSCN